MMKTQTSSSFMVKPFRNRNDVISWRVSGWLHGLRIRKNFKPKQDASVERGALDRNRSSPRQYDRHLYKLRHLVENAFMKLEGRRSIATRYAKTHQVFLPPAKSAALTFGFKSREGIV